MWWCLALDGVGVIGQQLRGLTVSLALSLFAVAVRCHAIWYVLFDVPLLLCLVSRYWVICLCDCP